MSNCPRARKSTYYSTLPNNRPYHSGPTGGHRQNPTFWILIGKSKISFMQKKPPKDLVLERKTRKYLLWRKFQLFTEISCFGLILKGTNAKIEKNHLAAMTPIDFFSSLAKTN